MNYSHGDGTNGNDQADRHKTVNKVNGTLKQIELMRQIEHSSDDVSAILQISDTNTIRDYSCMSTHKKDGSQQLDKWYKTKKRVENTVNNLKYYNRPGFYVHGMNNGNGKIDDKLQCQTCSSINNNMYNELNNVCRVYNQQKPSIQLT